jgi:hypothetical protein
MPYLVGVSVCRHLRKWLLSRRLGWPARSWALRSSSNGFGARLRATEFVEDRQGLLMVSGEVTMVVPQARVELAQPWLFGWRS